MWIPVNNSTTDVLYKRHGPVLFFEYKKQPYLEPSFHSHFVTLDFIEKCITLLLFFQAMLRVKAQPKQGSGLNQKHRHEHVLV